MKNVECNLTEDNDIKIKKLLGLFLLLFNTKNLVLQKPGYLILFAPLTRDKY